MVVALNLEGPDLPKCPRAQHCDALQLARPDVLRQLSVRQLQLGSV